MQGMKRNAWVATGLGICLMLAVFVLYAPSIRYEFINWDDIQYLADNPVVSNGVSLEGLKAAWSTAPESMWAPLLWISFMLDVELFGHQRRRGRQLRGPFGKRRGREIQGRFA